MCHLIRIFQYGYGLSYNRPSENLIGTMNAEDLDVYVARGSVLVPEKI